MHSPGSATAIENVMRQLIRYICINGLIGGSLGLVGSYTFGLSLLSQLRVASASRAGEACHLGWAGLSYAIVPILIVRIETKHARGVKKVGLCEVLGIFYTVSLFGFFRPAWMTSSGAVMWGVIAQIALYGVAIGPFALAFNALFINPFVRSRVEYKPTCESCGYSLRGLSTPRCPECGAPFDHSLLTAGADNKRQGHKPHQSQVNHGLGVSD